MQGLEFPDGLVVKNLTFNVGDTSSIPSQQTKTPHAKEQRSPHAAAKRENPCTDVAREVNKYLLKNTGLLVQTAGGGPIEVLK